MTDRHAKRSKHTPTTLRTPSHKKTTRTRGETREEEGRIFKVILHLTVMPVAADPTAPRRRSGSGRISISRGAPAGDQSERSI